jgi:membrane protein DedA with SNARE-associated domain
MDVATLVHNYGYAAVFVGSFLEGETVAALGGLAANRGYLALPWVIAIAAAGGFLGDQVYFGIGRLGGARLVVRSPNLRPGLERVSRLLDRYAVLLIIGVRFMYGLRIIGPMAIGMSRVSWLRFAVLNFVGAVLWALVVVGIGYVFGETLTWLFGDFKRVEKWGFAALLVTSVALAVVLYVRGRKRMMSGMTAATVMKGANRNTRAAHIASRRAEVIGDRSSGHRPC